jgi:hypothetical protein
MPLSRAQRSTPTRMPAHLSAVRLPRIQARSSLRRRMLRRCPSMLRRVLLRAVVVVRLLAAARWDLAAARLRPGVVQRFPRNRPPVPGRLLATLVAAVAWALTRMLAAVGLARGGVSAGARLHQGIRCMLAPAGAPLAVAVVAPLVVHRQRMAMRHRRRSRARFRRPRRRCPVLVS